MLPSRLRTEPAQSQLRSTEAGEHNLTETRRSGPVRYSNREAVACVRYTYAFTRYTCAVLANNLAADTPFRAGCG